jgi:aspartate/methionine/tyrosine aminotransferase
MSGCTMAAPCPFWLSENANATTRQARSFSKSYRRTGWRSGAGRRDLVQKATEMNEFIISHAPSMVQRAVKLGCMRESLESNPWSRD